MTDKKIKDVGDTVVYRKQGIYIIKEIKEQKIGGNTNMYYVLCSVYDPNSSVYVPVDCDKLTALMENPLCREEINSIIATSKERNFEWIDNSSERADFFESVIKSGDLVDLLKLLRLFLERKSSGVARQTRSFARDEKAFAAAQKMVTEAFAYPLGITKSEVLDYLVNT